jgi:phage gp36-like protein
VAYATRTDLTTHGLSSAALGSISTTAQDAALDAASQVADSYLRARYGTPVTGYGTDLTRAVCSLAAWDLLSVRGFDPQRGGDESLRLRAEDALRWLRDVSAGKASLSGITEAESEAWPEYLGAVSDEARGW